MLKRGSFFLIKPVPFLFNTIHLLVYVVEGGILFKALRKEASLLWEIKKSWGMWFSGCLLSSLFCCSTLLINIMNVSVVVTFFCPTKGLLLVYKEGSTDDYVECVLKSALWWAAVLFSKKYLILTHCFASGSCKRFSIQGRDRYQAVVVPPMEASGGKFVATLAAYAIFIRCSLVPLWPFCTTRIALLQVALCCCCTLFTKDMREFGARTALEGDLGRP